MILPSRKPATDRLLQKDTCTLCSSALLTRRQAGLRKQVRILKGSAHVAKGG